MTTRKTGRAWDHGDRTPSQRGYGRQHAKLRARLLAEQPICAICGTAPATIADHIVSIANGGPVHSMANLQGLCPPCHRTKSLQERGYRVKPTFGVDGWPIE